MWLKFTPLSVRTSIQISNLECNLPNEWIEFTIKFLLIGLQEI